MMSTRPTHLMNPVNGRGFPWTEALAKRGDLVPAIIRDGNYEPVASISDTSNEAGSKRTRFLFNPANNKLFPWTEQLAKRNDLIGMDSIPDNLEVDRNALEKVSTATEEVVEQVMVDEPPGTEEEDTADAHAEALPPEGAEEEAAAEQETDEVEEEIDTSKMDKKEMIAFAMENYGIKIKGNLGIVKVRKALEDIITTQDPIT